MSKHEEFFNNAQDNVFFLLPVGNVVTIEDLYQAFKSRLIAELTVDGWSQCGRIGGELKDKESGS